MTIPQDPRPHSPPPPGKLPQSPPPAESSFDALEAIQNEQQLREAFGKFNARSLQLESAYNLLRAQFQQVSAQLHEVYCQLEVKIKETDAAHTYLDNLMAQMSQGVLFVAKNGRILTCNPAMMKWLGTQAEARGKLIWDLVPDQHFGFSLKEALQRGPNAPENLATSPKSPGLEIAAKFITYFGDQLAEEQTEGLLLIGRDLAELRRLQTLASQRDRALDLRAIAESLAHETRAPLRAIETLSAEMGQTSASASQAAQISENCKSIDQIIAEVCEFAQPPEVKDESVDLAQLLTEIAELASRQNLLQSGQRLIWGGSAPRLIRADQELLKASLLNIVVNAAQAISESGSIELKLRQNLDSVEIEIADDGKGIPEDHLAKIFTPFFTTKKQSTGLGLAEVHKRIVAMNAQIDVQSKVDQGSSFTIKFPIS